MKKISYNLYKILLPVLFLSILVMACKEDEVNTFVPGRQFSPGIIKATSGETSVTLEWKPSLFADGVNYAVEISKDSTTFDPVEFRAVTTEPSILMTNDSLIIKQKYFARIKALGADEAHDSRWVTSSSFSIKGEQILLPVENIKYTSATLKWPAGTPVTYLMFGPTGGASNKIVLTDGEKAAGAKDVTGLTKGTNYTVEIYNNDVKRGNISFATPALNLPNAALTIFLKPTDVINQTTFDTLTKSSVVFVLLSGTTYGNNTLINLKNASNIIFFGEPVGKKPVMAFNGFNLPGTADTIRFENVDLTGYEYINNVETTTKRNYIFNQSTASAIAKVVFENCIIRNFVNTPFRIQLATLITVDKLVFNKCIAYDCGTSATTGTYAFVHVNATNASSKVNNIEITNSTLYNIGYSLILHNTCGSQSVKVQNCTFNDVIGNTRYFIDYNNFSVGSFTLSNCILGKSKSPAVTARGIRIASAGVSATSSYKTSDYAGNGTPIIGGLTDYTGLSTALFVDPSVGDFNFKDVNFAGISTVGDPRWRK